MPTLNKYSLRFFLCLFFIFSGILSFANMASPIRQGTKAATAFSSKNVDIIYENLYIKIHKDQTTASYIIEYKIKSDSAGKTIPLLFYAVGYKSSFQVSMDGKKIQTHSAKDSLQLNLSGFDYQFQSDQKLEEQWAQITWGPDFNWFGDNNNNYYERVSLKDFQYFEVNLDTGIHIIRVEYDAKAWENRSGWIKDYSFKYSLSPAKDWKSFGGLEIQLDASELKDSLDANIGEPHEGSFPGIAIWKFDTLPAEYLSFTYEPSVSTNAKKLIEFGPERMTICFGLFLMLIHILCMFLYRKKYYRIRFSWILIVGSLVFPFLFLMAFPKSFDVINSAIGKHAANVHGYMSILVLAAYPFIMPVYWLIMWVVDRLLKKRFRKKKGYSP